ncbi:uncharacterized protein LOC119670706 [Teleopsis dalmanni]|uniref:uncharacterized protein LOC119670706 n=1 Tax=Teleopsis dalmanni TaxID=139649 RepID=UPI0018CE55B5|nr:uncharacterized protein LOC119670706 [Teleopsis dalmanni]
MPGTGNIAPVAGATTASTSTKPKSTLHMNKTILKTVTIFLASGKRNSSNQSKSFDTTSQLKRRSRKQKMDELSGKINPKLLESLRKKTKFTKDEVDALCRIYRKLVSNCQYAAKTLAAGSSTASIAKPHSTIERNFSYLMLLYAMMLFLLDPAFDWCGPSLNHFRTTSS